MNTNAISDIKTTVQIIPNITFGDMLMLGHARRAIEHALAAGIILNIGGKLALPAPKATIPALPSGSLKVRNATDTTITCTGHREVVERALVHLRGVESAKVRRNGRGSSWLLIVANEPEMIDFLTIVAGAHDTRAIAA